MSDQKKGLPVRTEEDGLDGRLHSKIVDYLTPSQGAEVDTDKNLHVEIHGNDPTGADQVVRTSELGAVTPDGVYDGTNNTKPGNVGLVAHERNATPGDAQQTKRLTGVTNDTVHALDVAIRDESGAPFSSANPLPVVQVESEGDEINDYLADSAVAVDTTVNHDYTVTALKTLKLTQILMSASSRGKFEVMVETGVGTGIFTSKAVKFVSVATPNAEWSLREPIDVAAGVKVRVAKTNTDNQAQDMYSTICGHEV